MICWPFFAEQQINRTYVSQVCNIGIALNEVAERGEVEKKNGEETDDRKKKDKGCLTNQYLEKEISCIPGTPM
ncbi:hypothetical protein KI387_039582, partial [Taxus chinensis]